MKRFLARGMLAWTCALQAAAEWLDPTFDPGAGADGVVYCLAQQSDGKLLVGGAFRNFDGAPRLGLARLEENGALDPDFQPETGSPGDTQRVVVRAITIQPDGKILVGTEVLGGFGGNQTALLRLLPDGSRDLNFSVTGGRFGGPIVGSLGPYSGVGAIALDRDGEILVGGMFYPTGLVNPVRLVRFNSDGAVDRVYSYGNGIGSSDYVYAIQMLADGSFMLGGGFENYGLPDFQFGKVAPALRRLTSDGMRDPAVENFLPYGVGVLALTRQINGVLLAGGRTISGQYSSIPAGAFAARFLEDGSSVTIISLQAEGQVNAIGGEAGGSIVVGGTFQSIQGKTRSGLARFFPDGRLDQCFASGFFLSGSLTADPSAVHALQILTNGTALIAGNFLRAENAPQRGIARIILESRCAPGEVRFAASEFQASEDLGLAQVALIRNGNENSSVAVTLDSTDVTATAGADYTPFSGSVVFAPGETMKTVEIPIHFDGIVEGEEVVQLALRDPASGARIGTPNGARLRIADSDGLERVLVQDSDFRPEISGSFFDILSSLPDGRVLISSCDIRSTNSVALLTWLRADGSKEQELPMPAGLRGGCLSRAAVQPDGKLIVGGYLDGKLDAGLARLNADGSVDQSFTPPDFVAIPYPNGQPSFVTIFLASLFSDGKITVAGRFLARSGNVERRSLVRLFPDGEIDPSFNPNAEQFDTASGLFPQPDGKLLVFVYPDSPFRALRLTQDGGLDPTFVLDDRLKYFSPMALTSDGKTIFAGGPANSGSIVARANIDGSLDPTYAATLFLPGPETDPNLAASLLTAYQNPDDSLLIAGRFGRVDGLSSAPIVRLTPDGRLDAGFRANVSQFLTNTSSWIPSISGIQSSGPGAFLMRVGYFSSTGGSPVSTLAKFRVVATNTPPAFHLGLPNGSEIAEGATNAVAVVFRMGNAQQAVSVDYATIDGTALAEQDYTAVEGRLTFAPGERRQVIQVAITQDTRVEPSETFRLILRNPSSGAQIEEPSSLELRIRDDDSGVEFKSPRYETNELGRNIILKVRPTGVRPSGPVTVDYFTRDQSAKAGLDYLQTEGTLNVDFAFQTDATITIPIRDDALVEGDETFQVVLTNAHRAFLGEVPVATVTIHDNDTGSGPAKGADGMVLSLALQNDGRVLVGGSFSTLNGAALPGLARINPDLSIDATFRPSLELGAEVHRIALQGDGKVIIAGLFESVAGKKQEQIARLFSDGSLDRTFHPTTIPVSQRIATAQWIPAVQALAVQPDGRVLIGGIFTNVNGVARSGLARLNTDGTLHTNFLSQFSNFQPWNPGGDYVGAIAIQPDGRILVGGSFNEIQQMPHNGIARLYAHGGLDPSFHPELFGGVAFAGDARNEVTSLHLQRNGQILVLRQRGYYSLSAENPVVRLNPDGSRDRGFDPSWYGWSLFDYHSVYAAIEMRDGSIWVGGQSALIKIEPDGRTGLHPQLAGVGPPTLPSRDISGLTLPPMAVAEGRPSITALVEKQDGRILAAGNFMTLWTPAASYVDIPAFSLAEFSPNGFLFGLLHLSSPKLGSSGEAEFTVIAVPDQPFALETSTNLFDWQPILRVTPTTNLLQIVAPNIPLGPARFYRLRGNGN